MVFQTHDNAILWDRMERIFIMSMCMLAVTYLESLGSNPTWIFTALAGLAVQILVVKCWADILLESKPFDNCWSFKKGD